MLELVGVHLRARRPAFGLRGIDALDDIDAFLREALAAFEVTQLDYVESQRAAADARQRAALLSGLSDAYVKIAAPTTFAERVAEVCVQAQRFLDAEDARLEFGRPRPPEPGDDDLDEMAASLDGSGGLLTVRAKRGRTWTDDDRTTLAQLAVLISAPIDDARRLDFAQRLDRLGAALNEAADQDAIVAAVATSCGDVTEAADVSLWLADTDALEADREGDGSAQDARHEALQTVARSAGPYFTQRGDDEAWAVLPLNGARNRLGAIGFWFDDRQPFDGVQRDFLMQLADRVATALERVHAYERERAARQDAEIASDRFRSLQQLATEFARAATRRRVAQLLLRRVTEAAAAAGGMVAAADGRRFDLLAAVGALAPGADEAAAGDAPVDALLTALNDAGLAAVIEAVPTSVRTALAAAGVPDIELMPIRAGRRTVGVLALCWTDASAHVEGRDLVAAQVAMAGPALQRAERYDVEHDIAETLQRSMLVRPKLELDGVRWSVHYRAGSAGLAGGDWYDLYALDDRRMAIVVGDVVGQGVQAAAAMGQLRSATRAIAAVVSDPGELVATLDDYVTTTAQGEYSSMAYLVLDIETGDLHHALAGHPPPVLRFPDGTTELLESGRGPLLGLAEKRETATRRVPRGTQLVLYTDGLVERRDESVDAGIDRLRATIAAHGGKLDPEALCPALAAALVPPDQPVDDVAIVAVELL